MFCACSVVVVAVVVVVVAVDVDVVADVADVFVVVAAAVVERVEVVALEAWTKLELRCCYGQEVALATS